MKNITFLIIAAILCINGKSLAQDNDTRNKFQFGMKIGTNYSNVYDSEGEEFDADPKFGLAVGIFFAIPIGKFAGIQPEVLFSQKGFKATGKILNEPYKITRTTDYIDVPIFFAVKPVSFVTFLIGPQFSYLIKQKDVFENAFSTVAQEQEFENDNLRKNILGFATGADFNMNNLVISARGGWDMLNNNGDGSSTTPRYKNVNFQLTVGFRF